MVFRNTSEPFRIRPKYDVFGYFFAGVFLDEICEGSGCEADPRRMSAERSSGSTWKSFGRSVALSQSHERSRNAAAALEMPSAPPPPSDVILERVGEGDCPAKTCEPRALIEREINRRVREASMTQHYLRKKTIQVVLSNPEYAQ